MCFLCVEDKEVKYTAQQAYEEDLKRCPKYHDGGIRKSWAQLDDWSKLSWIKYPTPREFKHHD